jgi:REP element-mobilizing transposase RayT
LGTISLANRIRSYKNKTRLRGFKKHESKFHAVVSPLCLGNLGDRLPLITPDIQEAIYASIIGQCHKLGSTVIAIGGIEEHIHLLAGIPPTLSVSDLIKNVKGSSSHFVTHKIKPGEFFK